MLPPVLCQRRQSFINKFRSFQASSSQKRGQSYSNLSNISAKYLSQIYQPNISVGKSDQIQPQAGVCSSAGGGTRAEGVSEREKWKWRRRRRRRGDFDDSEEVFNEENGAQV